MGYVIINSDTIQKRIEEIENTDSANWEGQLGKIQALKYVLSQSIPLNEELEKAFDIGRNYQRDLDIINSKENFISNLKLSI